MLKISIAFLLAWFFVLQAVADTSPAEKISRPILYNEQTAFTLSEPSGEKSAAERAHMASEALISAIEAPMEGGEVASVKVQDQTATVYVRGHVVTAVYPQDAAAAGFANFNDYAEHLTTVLSGFVQKQIEKSRLQNIFVRTFLCVLFALIASAVIRQLRGIFHRFERVLAQKRDSLKPVSWLSQHFLSPQMVGGLMAIALAIGRFAAYAAVLVMAVTAILGQFEVTRNILVQTAQNGINQFGRSLQAIFGAIPNLFLTLVLVIALWISFRALDLFSKGLRNGSIQWKYLSGQRIAIARIFGTIAIVIVLVPLILLSLFGRFQTPWETLLIAIGACAGLAAVPIAASCIVGIVFLWQSKIHVGEWIAVGESFGEIAAIRFTEVVVIPLDGGSLTIPMLSLLFRPLHRVQGVGRFRLLLEMRTQKKITEALNDVRRLFSPDVNIELKELHHDKIALIIEGNAQTDARQTLMKTVADGMSAGHIDLLRCHFV